MGKVIIYPSNGMSGGLPPISATAGQTIFDAGVPLSPTAAVFVDGLLNTSTYTISGTTVVFTVGLLEGQTVRIYN